MRAAMETASSGGCCCCCCCCHKQLDMNINIPSACRSFGKILMMWQDKQTATKHRRALKKLPLLPMQRLSLAYLKHHDVRTGGLRSFQKCNMATVGGDAENAAYYLLHKSVKSLASDCRSLSGAATRSTSPLTGFSFNAIEIRWQFNDNPETAAVDGGATN